MIWTAESSTYTCVRIKAIAPFVKHWIWPFNLFRWPAGCVLESGTLQGVSELAIGQISEVVVEGVLEIFHLTRFVSPSVLPPAKGA